MVFSQSSKEDRIKNTISFNTDSNENALISNPTDQSNNLKAES